MKFNLSYASEKGQRSYQEDTWVLFQVDCGRYLLAVFDGHGGDEVAQYCANRLLRLYTDLRKKNSLLSIPQLFELLFKELHEETWGFEAGSSASIVLVSDTEAVVGVLGDSPVLIKQADGVLWLAPEHNVGSNLSEAEAAKRRGGFVNSGYLYASFSGLGLQLSRALGDFPLDSVLSRKPDIFQIPLGPGSFVLVASDGVFDPAHKNSPVKKIGMRITEGGLAKNLVDDALAIPTYDNATAVLLQLSSSESELIRCGLL